jgi:hypothetical protein
VPFRRNPLVQESGSQVPRPVQARVQVMLRVPRHVLPLHVQSSPSSGTATRNNTTGSDLRRTGPSLISCSTPRQSPPRWWLRKHAWREQASMRIFMAVLQGVERVTGSDRRASALVLSSPCSHQRASALQQLWLPTFPVRVGLDRWPWIRSRGERWSNGRAMASSLDPAVAHDLNGCARHRWPHRSPIYPYSNIKYKI